MENSKTIVAIDGPAGSGKSTIAKLLAEELNIEYIDSGAIYRTLTLYGMETFAGSCAGYEKQIADFFNKNPEVLRITYEDHAQKMWLNNRDVSRIIRDPKVTLQVKYIADCQQCRSVVNDRIRKTAKDYPVVIDGRDIGTIVFPETPFKFYLDAQPETRARRRAKDLNIPLEGDPFKQLLSNINERDKHDMEREIAPLKKAGNAYYLDTTNLKIEDVLNKIIHHFEYLGGRIGIH